MPWRPIDGEAFPTLGFHVADQMAEYLDYVVSREQLEFLIRLYEIDPLSCKRIKTRAVIQRPRGWGKSPFLAATGIGEALFEVVPDGWDADGQPVARPWIDFKTIINVPVTATSDDQVQNTWAPMLEMARTDALVNEFDAARVRDSSRRYSCLGLAFHPPFRGRARVQECGPDPRPERHLGLSRSRQAPVAYLPTSIAPVVRTVTDQRQKTGRPTGARTPDTSRDPAHDDRVSSGRNHGPVALRTGPKRTRSPDPVYERYPPSGEAWRVRRARGVTVGRSLHEHNP